MGGHVVHKDFAAGPCGVRLRDNVIRHMVHEADPGHNERERHNHKGDLDTSFHLSIERPESPAENGASARHFLYGNSLVGDFFTASR